MEHGKRNEPFIITEENFVKIIKNGIKAIEEHDRKELLRSIEFFKTHEYIDGIWQPKEKK